MHLLGTHRSVALMSSMDTGRYEVVAGDIFDSVPSGSKACLPKMAGGRERTLAGHASTLDDASFRPESVHELALENGLPVAAPL